MVIVAELPAVHYNIPTQYVTTVGPCNIYVYKAVKLLYESSTQCQDVCQDEGCGTFVERDGTPYVISDTYVSVSALRAVINRNLNRTSDSSVVPSSKSNYGVYVHACGHSASGHLYQQLSTTHNLLMAEQTAAVTRSPTTTTCILYALHIITLHPCATSISFITLY